MKKTVSRSACDISDVLEYIAILEKDPKEKERFNRSVRRAAEKERKRPGGEFSALFLDAIRIP